MQRERKYREELFDMENQFERLGRFQSMRPRSSFFEVGGRDPFDDPFFTRPFETVIGSGSTAAPAPPPAPATAPQMNKGIKIQELDSDDDDDDHYKEKVNFKGADADHGSTKQPSVHVHHPDDDDEHADANEWNLKDVNRRSDANKLQGTKTKSQSFSFRTSRVTYGGVDGAYYTSTKTRRTGSDGTTLEESKEADSTTGQATHKISRGIHDKGHSVTRRLKTDGKVDTLQTLHNIDKDELGRFYEAWEGNVQGHGHGNKGISKGEQGQLMRGGGMLPSLEQGASVGDIPNGGSFGGSTNRAKKVVRINIE